MNGNGVVCGDNNSNPIFHAIVHSAYVPSLGKAQMIARILQKDWHLFEAVFWEAGFSRLTNGCWIDHEHNSGVHFWDYVFYQNDPDGKNFMYGHKVWGKGEVFLFKIDWVDDKDIYENAVINP